MLEGFTSMKVLFKREFDVEAEMLSDFTQQALAAMPTVTSHRLSEGGDRIEFRTSFTLTSWGDKMEATVEPGAEGKSVMVVRGEPRVGILSTPWGEEVHATTIETQLFGALLPLVEAARTNPILLLQADHRRVEALFAAIAASEGDARRDLVGQVVKALKVHMQLEERHVYPKIAEQVADDDAEEAEAEHELTREVLAHVEDLAPDDPGFDGALAMLVAGIEHHVAEEEGEAFPALATALGPNGLASLADEMRPTRAELLAQPDQSASASSSEGKESSSRRRRSSDDRHRSSDQPARPRSTSRQRRNRVDPDTTSRADLLQQAKRAGVAGYSHMTKAELAKAISRA
jgi:hemerythrin superfamily protein